ncbi:AraC family transcriptional regulator [Marinomonas rhizomae]|uniref:AraC family transcriptional regulator n=1 Tax=Marinomonas rhizomae TaxID=491948 RepID=A0A366IY68_9GAMM|nr:helix-turn-helix domain-containing protein [Marinomonas rhizomae]RBP79029.1 AraC family transcriptional regulator [Marinomonas rhizomae]RNF71253.1 AraC family transcriptional regulator [Marinomonas rhizomae]
MYLNKSHSWEISLIGLSLTLFTLTHLLTKSHKHKTDWLLCLWLFILNIPLIHSTLAHININIETLFFFSNPTLHLLNGPILYCYTRMLISKEKRVFKGAELLHFLPFVLFYVLFISMPPSSLMLPQPERNLTVVGDAVIENDTMSLLEGLLFHFGFINVLIFIGYSIATLITLRQHRINIADFFSQHDSQVSLRWIYALPITFVILVLFNVVYEAQFSASEYIDPITRHMLSFSIFILLLCFFGIKQKPVFQLEHKAMNENEIIAETSTDSELSPNKLEAVRPSTINNDFVTETINNMQLYLQQEKPFLDPDFSVYALAEALNIPRRTLSLVISTGLSKNFYQYVNEFRINEVKRLLENQDDKMTIIDLAYRAGFNSKSSFNSLFKKHCGVTPSQYRKMVKKPENISCSRES